MKKLCYLSFLSLLFCTNIFAQKVQFEEYDLSNGMHVILHKDNTAPVIITSVMYHVGAKDENPERTGFAHFFEHLLFEGTKNIERGEWFKIVSANGGTNNANTTQDRTYYYEVFPSNNLELGLWMESERLLHPVINQIGVDTQNEVVKEEKRLRVDNSPYGQWIPTVFANLFVEHPYRWTTIGSLEHLDAASLEEFQAFNKKFYVPNNAVLVVAGDFETEKTKKLIEDYFGSIPKGEAVVRETITEKPITSKIEATFEDPNIQIPAVFTVYRTPAMTTRDARVLDMISTILSDGKSSRLYKKLVDDKKKALQVAAFNYSLEDYGAYIIFALPLGENTLDDLVVEMDEEITKLQTELISEKELQKLRNKFENQFVNANSSVEGIAGSLATYYMLYNDVNLINTEIDIYNSITREEIREIAKKYLNPNQQLVLDYLPKKEIE
ncbi:insulinase family protein [Lutibacter sp. HS1-25]|uniref:M16 family metallopeptidase n=1 Tax=Lutibacter sp. HS1-25 TaxID=2485000 RepID=UPI001011FB3A|nr:pitrilysin family protein [Lutibacter sp. HS1-25]RXP44981.1 insulinase family protein [Lutibacter sp. HS1-25]